MERTAKQELAGILVFIGTGEFLTAMMIGASLRPSYSIATNTISDLGVGSTALLFNSSIIILGILVIAAAYLLKGALNSALLSILLVLTGIGAAGVGLFPETTGAAHSVFALIAFVFEGLAAIYSSRFTTRAFGIISVILGVITLAALVLFSTGNYFSLHEGGMERMIVYPSILWALAFSGFLQSGKLKLHDTASAAP
jgi:hypothetical membrane protein